MVSASEPLHLWHIQRVICALDVFLSRFVTGLQAVLFEWLLMSMNWATRWWRDGSFHGNWFHMGDHHSEQ